MDLRDANEVSDAGDVGDVGDVGDMSERMVVGCTCTVVKAEVGSGGEDSTKDYVWWVMGGEAGMYVLVQNKDKYLAAGLGRVVR